MRKPLICFFVAALATACSPADSDSAAPDARPTSMPATIDAGPFPNGVAANAEHIFVALGARHAGPDAVPTPQGERSVVQVFSATDGSLVKEIDVASGGHSLRLTPDGSELYLAHYSFDRTVTVISVADLEVTAVVGGQLLSPLGVPDSIAISADGRYAYVGSNGVDSAWVSRIDTATHAIDPNWQVDVIGGYVCWVELSGQDELYVNSWTGGTVQRKSIAGEVGMAMTPVGSFPHAVSIVGDYAYALVSGGNRVVKLDATTLAEVAEVVGPWAGNWGGPVSGQLSRSGKSLFVANHALGQVAVVDVDPTSATYDIVTRTFGAGDDPIFMALSPSGETLYVANNESSTISVIDVSTDP